MATLNQGTSGLQGWGETPPTKKLREPKTEVLVPQRCNACRCEVPLVAETRSRKVRTAFVEGMCTSCAEFFGWSFSRGCTNWTPEQTLKNLARLREDNFVMLLRNRSLVARDGNILNLGAGDIMQCVPTNPEIDVEGRPSKEWTWRLFTLNIAVGPYEVRLFPHEWSPIAFKTVMELKSAGEIEECFLSDTDKVGHFTPTPELRRQIEACFGRLTG